MGSKKVGFFMVHMIRVLYCHSNERLIFDDMLQPIMKIQISCDSQDQKKAAELMIRGAELGSMEACTNLGNAYNLGLIGLEKDFEKGKQYLELAAIKGGVEARYMLGCGENNERTVSRGVKHFMIGARAGHTPCLESVKKAFTMGYATKDEYEETLRAYQKSVDAVKSEQRERARVINTPANDEDLFKNPPPRKDCPICAIPMPFGKDVTYLVCCGKEVCGGCVYAMDVANPQRNSCGVCGMSAERSMDEHIKRIKKRMKKNDPNAYNILGLYFKNGSAGLPKDTKKAMELWMKSGQLGHGRAFQNIVNAYEEGRGVGRSSAKARHYNELGAMAGDEVCRHNLGCMDNGEGHKDRAVRHWMISASRGNEKSLQLIGRSFKNGDVSKDDYEKTLRAYTDSINVMKSEQRSKAAQLRNQGLGTNTPIDDPSCIVS